MSGKRKKMGTGKKRASQHEKRKTKKPRKANTGGYQRNANIAVEESDQKYSDTEDMQDDEDLQYLRKEGKNLSFLTSQLEQVSIVSRNKEKGVKRKKSEHDTVQSDASDLEDEQENFERAPRRFPQVETTPEIRGRPLLPIKGKHGIIPQFAAVAKEVEDDDKEKQTENEDDEEELLDAKEQVLTPATKLQSRKERIATLSLRVISNPEESLKSLKELCRMLDEKEQSIAFSVKKLTAMSLLEVFKDIIPGYRIRLPDDDEKSVKLKKETKQLHEFEQALLRQYKNYLAKLDLWTQGLSKKKNKETEPQKVLLNEKLGQVAVTCLCGLLVAKPFFNLTVSIIGTLIPFLAHKDELVAQTCFKAFTQLYREDKLGEVSLTAVKQTEQLVRARAYNVPRLVLDTFLSLQITSIIKENADASGKLKHKEKLQKFSKRQFKRQKRMEKLEHELRETQAEESTKQRSQFQTEILNHLFATYVRILKQAPSSPVLSSVLDGLAKFALLINVEMLSDLFHLFKNHLKSGIIDFHQSLRCIRTVFTILSGHGEALNVDPLQFYIHFYTHLIEFNASSNAEDMNLCLRCLDLLLLKRRKQVSTPRLLAFVKRMSTLTMQLDHAGAIGILAVMKETFLHHRTLDVLLDTDTSTGSGLYLPELDDPEHCNPSASVLWELPLLKRHYHPTVRQLALYLRAGAKAGKLPTELTSSSPVDLFWTYSPSPDQEFHPSPPEPSSKPISKTAIKRQRMWIPKYSETRENLQNLSFSLQSNDRVLL